MATDYSVLLKELKDLRAENLKEHNSTRASVQKLEKSVSQVNAWIETTKEQIEEMESGINRNDERGSLHERALRYLIKKDAEMTNKYEDRMRRNNLRIYQVPEESEGKDMKTFMKHLLTESLKLPPDVDLIIERAHRSLTAKPKGPNASPRSIIVRFLDFTVKERILQTAWSQEVTDLFWP